MCHVHFLDGSVKAIAINPAETVASIMCRIQEMLSLKDIHGWALYEVGEATITGGTRSHIVYDGTIIGVNRPAIVPQMCVFFPALLQEGSNLWLYFSTDISCTLMQFADS